MCLDEFFMKEALEEAKKAFTEDEVPVGAVAVFEGEIIARAHNQVESLMDASAHAELLCLKKAAKIRGNWRLSGVTLYTTLEPCCLCVGAIFSFRIDRIVWGAPDLRQGADGSWVSVLSESHPMHSIDIARHVLADECGQWMRQFFGNKRRGRSGENI